METDVMKGDEQKSPFSALIQNLRSGKTLDWSLVTSLLLSAGMFLWEWKTLGSIEFSGIPIFFVLFFTFFLYGRAVLVLVPHLSSRTVSIPFLFVLGFFTQNTLLLLFFLVFPWPLRMDFYLSVFLGGCLSLIKKKKEKIIGLKSIIPSAILLIISFAAISLLCADSMVPFENEKDERVYFVHFYIDSYTHARYIGALAHASSNIFDISSLGSASSLMQPYHYSIYLPSAVIKSFTDNHLLDILQFSLIPVGLLLMTCALYSIVELKWGSWIGLIGGCSVLLIPDGYFQGMGNKFYSFAFTLVAVPGLAYGIACAALAWLFVLRGVRLRLWRCIITAWAFAIALVTYKAQLFIAVALSIVMYPLCFYPRISWWIRIIYITIALIEIVFLSRILSFFPAIPNLTLDGSAVEYMLDSFLRSMDEGQIKAFYIFLWSESTMHGAKYLLMALFETVAELGPLGIVIVAMFLFARRKRGEKWFPIFSICVYYIMSLGLALNTHGYAPEELIHRPFVWFYAVVFFWCFTGLLADWIKKRFSSKTFLTRSFIAGCLVISLLVPYAEGFGLQTLPSLGKGVRRIPIALVVCCKYLRDNTDKDTLVMDFSGDPRLAISCLAERQDFDTFIPNRRIHPSKRRNCPQCSSAETHLRLLNSCSNTTWATRFWSRTYNFMELFLI